MQVYRSMDSMVISLICLFLSFITFLRTYFSLHQDLVAVTAVYGVSLQCIFKHGHRKAEHLHVLKRETF